jgi:hypothetical protein
VALAGPFSVDLGTAQNRFYDALHGVYPVMKGRAEAGDAIAAEWLESFVSLGELLRVRVG